jgi:hypothetical protein
VDIKVARAILSCAIPINVVQSPYWQDMLREVSDAPRCYKGPNFEKVHTTHLWKERLIVESVRTDLFQ